jgi:hypothetical protein
MQNISAVLNEMGKPWIPGLVPAANVGANVKAKLTALLSGASSQKTQAGQGVVSKPGYREQLPQMRAFLIAAAARRSMVTYGDVMKAFGIHRGPLRHALSALGHQSEDNKEPIITALVVNQETGRCSEGIVEEFGVVDDAAEREKLYALFRPAFPAAHSGPQGVTSQAERFAKVAVRPKQRAFRRAVYLAYNGRCAISGCDVEDVLDAAHRRGRNWKVGHNAAADGLLLRKDLHALYDAGLLTISENGKVALHPAIRGHYGSFENETVPAG